MRTPSVLFEISISYKDSNNLYETKSESLQNMDIIDLRLLLRRINHESNNPHRDFLKTRIRPLSKASIETLRSTYGLQLHGLEYSQVSPPLIFIERADRWQKEYEAFIS